MDYEQNHFFGIVDETLNSDNITHAFFGRNGGVSEGLYKSLNTGLGSGDDQDKVQENRQRVVEAIGCDRLVTVYQVHSNDAVFVDGKNDEWEGQPPKADGMVTNTPRVALAILTADCAPVLFADKKNKVVAACHAGWKPAIKGIIKQTVTLMQEYGAEPNHTQAVVGPTISQEAYEVGPEFVEEFVSQDANNAKFFDEANGKARFNLPEFVRAKLEEAGVGNTNIVNRCTYNEKDNFYSYRRATHNKQKNYGRQISAIMIK